MRCKLDKSRFCDDFLLLEIVDSLVVGLEFSRRESESGGIPGEVDNCCFEGENSV